MLATWVVMASSLERNSSLSRPGLPAPAGAGAGAAGSGGSGRRRTGTSAGWPEPGGGTDSADCRTEKSAVRWGPRTGSGGTDSHRRGTGQRGAGMGGATAASLNERPVAVDNSIDEMAGVVQYKKLQYIFRYFDIDVGEPAV